MMEKYITDERTGLKYELVGDYYLVVGDDEPEEDQPIGVWGQRHLRHLKRHHKVIYANLLTSGKLPEYLADIDRQAEELFLRLAKQTADAEGITEKLKASDQMEWVRQMNSIRNRAIASRDFVCHRSPNHSRNRLTLWGRSPQSPEGRSVMLPGRIQGALYISGREGK